jgi:uncharacterized protein YacL
LAERKIHVGGKEIGVGLVYAIVVLLFELYQLHEHPDIKAVALHLAEPIIVPVIVAILAGVSLSTAWAAFKRAGRAVAFLIKWTLISGVLIGLFVVIAKGSPLAALTIAFVGANIVAAIASLAKLAKGVSDFNPVTTPDPNAPPQPEPSGPPAPVQSENEGAPGADPDPDPWGC